MLQKYEKYDYRVQIIRILACFIVITCHVRIEPVINGVLDKLYLLLYVFFNDGVTIFFIIMGFFAFDIKKPIWRGIGKTFLRILVPIIIAKFCTQLINDWIINETSLWECLLHPSISLSPICKELLSMNFTSDNYYSHLWYISTYLNIVIIIPVLKLLTLENTYASSAFKWLIFINLTGMLITDLQYLLPLEGITINNFNIFGNLPVASVLIGHMLRKNQHMLKHTVKHRILFIAGMISIVTIRFIVQLLFINNGSDNNYINYWNTTFSLIFSVCFVCFFLTFPDDKTSPCLRMINYIGTKTYVIYIIHMAIYTFWETRNIKERIYAITLKNSDNVIAKVGYDLILPVIIYICCLLITIALDYIKILLHSIYRLTINRRKSSI